MKIKCICIDDTPLALRKLEGFIERMPLLENKGSFTDGIDAITFIRENPVDLVFLDIQMESFTGLQFLEALGKRAHVIIISAYPEYAIEGFNHNVTDYLLKPYSFERFLTAIDKVQSSMDSTYRKDHLFLKTEYRMERVDFKDILYIEGEGAYLKFVLDGRNIMTLMSFQHMNELLPPDLFMRVHKSYVIAINKIQSVEKGGVIIRDKRIPVGETYRKDFMEKLDIG